MIPYATFTYFGILLYPVIPTVILGLLGRVSWRWVLLVSLAMLAVQYSGTVGILPQTAVNELWLVGAYAAYQWFVAWGFMWLRPRAAGLTLSACALVLALLPLAVSKFLPLVAPASLIGFLGISYVTFRCLDVIFGIHDRLIKTLPLGRYFAYVFFFPTISSGPIDRYRRFEKDWVHKRSRAEFVRDLDGGLHRIFVGFLYKFILAALVKQYWLDPITAGAGLANTISYMYAYSMFLFFDFAGYSAFAIGVSYIFGIHTPENFNRPFLSENISDFWRRWHITLSTWLRDHVYMRFMIAALKGRWFKNKYIGSYLGFFLAFGLMGLWHGTAANYLLYGLYHGALLSAHDWFQRWNAVHKLWGEGRVWRVAGIAITLNLVCFGFLIFSGRLGPAQPAPVSAAPRFQGVLELVDCDQIKGWAWDSSQPNVPILLDLYEGDFAVETGIVAGDARPDLSLGDNGLHGFAYPLPSTLKDGKAHSLSVRFSGSNESLKNSPQQINCSPSIKSK